MDPGGKIPDYYEILQIHERAIPEVAERVYRVLARKYHPDVHPAEKKKWAEQMMTELNVAYSVISDARRRAEYDAQRRQAQWAGVSVSDVAEGAATKCFNHPKRPSTGFCFWCGRPICDLCHSPNQPHTMCTTCEQYAVRTEEEPAEPPETAWPFLDRPMGLLGVAAYYGIMLVLAAAIAATAVDLADAMGASARHIHMGLVVLGVVVLLLFFRGFTWRAVCPRCHRMSSRAGFRATSPWRRFFAPNTACVGCGYWFEREELEDAFR
ncbi:MAG: J domain-containing protein [Armatimonadota bacterium]|jgi:hypothetical protein